MIAKVRTGAIHPEPPSVGLLRVGDAPLALGEDATARVLLSSLGPGARLAFVEMVGSDPVDVADALERAVRRELPVVIWAAGEAAAEWSVEVCLAARERGRAAVGLPLLAAEDRPFGRRIGQLFWLRGEVDSLPLRWASALPEIIAAATAVASETVAATVRIPWAWPETAQASAIRLEVEEAYPQVLQRLVRGGVEAGTSLALELAAPSRTQLAAAGRLLRRALASAQPRERARPRSPGPGK
ncbi:MAG: hypothetical protein ACK4XK_03500 [Casimicrobiaceae bacterium]